MQNLHIKKPFEGCSNDRYRYYQEKVKETPPWQVRQLISGDCEFFIPGTSKQTRNIKNIEKCSSMGCSVQGGKRMTRMLRLRRSHQRKQRKTRKRRTRKN